MGRQGEYKYPDGSIYNGHWNEQGQRQGYGHISFPDGNNYWGRFENGLYGEVGVMALKNGSRYAGEFKNGNFHGFGVFQRVDGMSFEGEFKDGQIFGMGIVTFSDGTHGLPRNEGFFEQCKITRREKCPAIISKAREVAKKAEHARTMQ